MNKSIESPSPAPVTRRNFLKSASTAVTGGVLLGALPAERFAFGAAADETLKLALIGCGGRGSGATNEALSTSGPLKLVAMADAFEDRLESSLQNLKAQHRDKVDVPAERQFVGFDAYKQAIALADVVILASPPGFRPIHFEEAVKQNKHVFQEKPVATDAPGIRRFLAAAEESKRKNLKVVVGLQRHYDPKYIETIKRIHDGAIGDILAGRCYWNDAGVWVKPREPGMTEMEYQMRNWYYFVWLSGDHIVEQHVHNLDVINWVKQAYPVKCNGMGGRQVRTGKEYGEIFDHHAVEFEYADGTRMFSQCRHIRGCWSNVSEYVVGTKGSSGINSGVLYGPEGKMQWRFRAQQLVNPYQQEHEELFAAIRQNTPLNDAENGGKSTLTGIMGRMATYSGQIITWDDALNSEINLLPDEYTWEAKPKVLPDADGFYPVAVPGQTVTV